MIARVIAQGFIKTRGEGCDRHAGTLPRVRSSPTDGSHACGDSHRRRRTHPVSSPRRLGRPSGHGPGSSPDTSVARACPWSV